MAGNLSAKTGRLIAANRRRRRLYAAMLILAAVIAVSVFYILSNPALTLDGEANCGFAEHTHDEVCYADTVVCGFVEADDNAEAPEATEEPVQTLALICGLEETLSADSGENDVAPVAEGDENAESGDIVEPLEPQGHTHGDECYVVVTPEPDAEAGTEAHVHTDECFVAALVCELNEHVHGDFCYAAMTLQGDFAILLTGDLNSHKLVNFLDSVTIRDSDGNLIDNDSTVYVGENYTISLNFSEKYDVGNTQQFQYLGEGAEKYLVYELPSNIVVQSPESGTIYFENTNAEIGAYWIENGFLYVRFGSGLDVDGTENPSLGEYIDEFLNVSFGIDIAAQVESSGGDNEVAIEFGDGTTITVVVKQREGGIDVTKESFGYNYVTRTIDYKVRVRAVGGSVSDISLVENVGWSWPSTNIGLQIANITAGGIYDSSGVSNNTPIGVSLTEISSGNYTIDLTANGQQLSLEAGEYVELVYTVKFADGTAVQSINNYIKNTVTATGKTPDDGDTEDTASREVPVSVRVTNKGSGTIKEIDGVKYIEWTSFAGDGYANFQGGQIVDTLTGNTEFYTGIPLVINTRTISADGSPTLLETRTGWDNVTLSNSNKTFTYNVPAGDTAKLRYEFVYYTTFPSDGNTIDISNSFTATPPGEQGHTSNAGVEVGDSLTKFGQLKYDPETGKQYIEYVVTARIPGSVYGIRTWFYDILEYNYGPTVEQDVYSVSFDLRDSAGNLIDESRYQPRWIRNEGAYAYEAFFVFGDYDPDHPSFYDSRSEWPIDFDTTLTITYKLSLDSIVRGTDGKTLGEVFVNGSGHTYDPLTNRITLNFNNVKSLTATDTMTRGITKQAVRAYYKAVDGYYKWIYDNIWYPDYNSFNEDEYAEAGLNGNIGFYYQVIIPQPVSASGANAKAPVFTDYFDERLMFVPTSLIVTESYSGNRFAGWDAPDRENTNPGPNWKYPLNRTDLVDKSIPGQISLDLAKIVMRDNWLHDNTYEPAEYNWFVSERQNTSLTISYILAFPGDAPAGTNTYNNTAQITKFADKNDERGITIGASTDVTYGKPVVDKTMATKGTRAGVKININPQGLQLTEDGSMITVEDIMTNLSFYSSSLTIKYYEGGELKTAASKLVTAPELYGYMIGKTEEGNEKVTFWIPDRTPIIIEYDTLVNASIDETVDISNAVKVIGSASYSDEYSLKYLVQSSEGSGTASVGKLMIIKQDELDTETYLPGAKFDLYTENPAFAPEGSSTLEITVGGSVKTFYLYQEVITTGTNGTVTIENGSAMLPGTVWALVETKAPDGYKPLTEPIVFMFGGMGGGSIDGVIVIADTIAIPNTAYHVALPNTGGSGTILYTAAGIMLAAISVTILSLRKRRGGYNIN